MNGWYAAFGKRVLDLCVAVPATIVLSPFLLLLAMIVRVGLGAPILFWQRRSGRHGKPFWIAKFRTMTCAEEGETSEEARMTPLGEALRRWSLDELPQLLNVLKGDMSLVGPRPLYPEYDALYDERQRLRLLVKPGVTGWSQVNGRNALSWPEKLEQDAWYVEHSSLALDLAILWRTRRSVVHSGGYAPEGQARMPRFQGERGMTKDGS